MRYCLLPLVMMLLLGCADPNGPDNATPQVVAGGTGDANEPRFEFKPLEGFLWNSEHRIWYGKEFRTSITPSHAESTTIQAVADDFGADRMLESKMELMSKDFREVEGRNTLLVHAKRLNGKYPQEVCTVAFATKGGVAQITAIYPSDMTPEFKTQIESALLQSKWVEP